MVSLETAYDIHAGESGSGGQERSAGLIQVPCAIINLVHCSLFSLLAYALLAHVYLDGVA